MQVMEGKGEIRNGNIKEDMKKKKKNKKEKEALTQADASF